MDSKKHPVLHGISDAVVVDLAKYKRGLKSATRKPRRKKAPQFEILVCPCGGHDFKFVLASDVDHLRNTVACTSCCQPVKDPSTLRRIIELAEGLL